MDKTIRLTEETPKLQTTEAAVFMAIIGGLMYAACSTRPDIVQYAVNQLVAYYMSKPTETHLQAAKHILRYLRGQDELVLTYKYSSTSPEKNGLLILIITYSDSS